MYVKLLSIPQNTNQTERDPRYVRFLKEYIGQRDDPDVGTEAYMHKYYRQTICDQPRWEEGVYTVRLASKNIEVQVPLGSMTPRYFANNTAALFTNDRSLTQLVCTGKGMYSFETPGLTEKSWDPVFDQETILYTSTNREKIWIYSFKNPEMPVLVQELPCWTSGVFYKNPEAGILIQNRKIDTSNYNQLRYVYRQQIFIRDTKTGLFAKTQESKILHWDVGSITFIAGRSDLALALPHYYSAVTHRYFANPACVGIINILTGQVQVIQCPSRLKSYIFSPTDRYMLWNLKNTNDFKRFIIDLQTGTVIKGRKAYTMILDDIGYSIRDINVGVLRYKNNQRIEI